MLSHTAQDSQALWEEELKSRSKLGLRLAELEKEKGELNTQVIKLMCSCDDLRYIYPNILGFGS